MGVCGADWLVVLVSRNRLKHLLLGFCLSNLSTRQIIPGFCGIDTQGAPGNRTFGLR